MIIVSFNIFKVFKVAYGVEQNAWPRTLRGFCSRIGPWNNFVFYETFK